VSQIQTSPYVVTAWTPQGIVQQTRTIAASAVVLAIRLREEGHTVEVQDPMGKPLSLEDVRDSVLNVVSERVRTR
jgi:hypothetical protein